MSTSDKFVQPSIPKFDGHYDYWSMTMENFLRSKEMWNMVEEGIPTPATGTAAASEAQRKVVEEAKLKDMKVKNYLFQAIDREILETILDKRTSKAIWESMKQKYQGSTKVRRAQLQALRREFELLAMKEGEKVDSFLGRTLTVVNKMKTNGETMEQSTVVGKILRSLTNKFNYVVCSIEESNDLNNLSIDELHGSLLVHEQRMQGCQEEEHALKVVQEDRSGRGRGRGMSRGGRGRELNEEELLLMAHVESRQTDEEDVWFLDSGCSNHMTGNKKWFSSLVEDHSQSVKLGNDTRMAVVAKGSIRVQINGIIQVISDVYYIPELKNNLLSIGQLQERASKTHMCLQAENVAEKEAHMWHCRFGHLNHKGLRTLVYNQMVIGLPSLKTPKKMCTTCLTGKQHREPTSGKSLWRASHQLQLVHSDICGPIKPASNSGKRYILSFIDDFSRKTWVYFLHEKSEAFVTFKNYKAYVEKEIGAHITCLRTDRGGEFTSNEFREFCQTQGINRQLTTAFTPQQNGVAERKNRTIMNAVRSMLSEKKVPRTFWPEAVKWCVHIQNRSPTAAIEKKTPEEAWSGEKPTVEYFRIFGCIAHVHVPDQRRSKLDDKSRKCIFLGVSDESKAWRLYDPVSEKVVTSKDVVFEEEESWDWENMTERKQARHFRM
ncbi:hypothetical protein OSB04_020022 [Centaurea solstitialis]|uniref:Integrase catalytic domain-containing protein n=1 Tax=Centaurea solstitialis TaxID=347529 RepID=A0AA38ST25_9ASTR|nr:hypothetical protein OSB04_020022 [Centaurea solstitialis]